MNNKKPKQHDCITSKESLDRCFSLVREELSKAETKFPGFPDDLLHGVCILSEESGEAVRAALHVVYENGSVEEYKKELVQTAAMAIRALIDLEIREQEVKNKALLSTRQLALNLED